MSKKPKPCSSCQGGSLLIPSSLIKMLYWMCEKSGLPPTWPQLEHAIRRNFGGMESDELDPLEEFKQRIHIRDVPHLQSISKEVYAYPILFHDDVVTLCVNCPCSCTPL